MGAISLARGRGREVREKRAKHDLPPDTSAHVATAGCEETTLRAWGNGDHGVLVTLQHQLRVAGAGVPELNAAILGSTEDPHAIGRQGDAENEVLYRHGSQPGARRDVD